METALETTPERILLPAEGLAGHRWVLMVSSVAWSLVGTALLG
jgi:hypothetical protein